MMPNYFIIGAAKAASSSLCASLGQHPDIFMVDCKEPCFFSDDKVYARGLPWYESLYDSAGKKKMRGEGSNHYSMKECYPHTVQRLVEQCPDAKLIYIVRDPLERIESMWLQRRSHGGEQVHYDFNTAVRRNRDALVDASNYLKQIDAYRSHFPDERILVLFFEDFRAESQSVLRRCYEFLEVDPEFVSAENKLHINPSKGKPVVRPEFSKVRSKWYYRLGKAALPAPLRDAIINQQWFSRLKFQPAITRPHWRQETLDWVTEILADDTTCFLARYGKAADFWSLDQNGVVVD